MQNELFSDLEDSEGNAAGDLKDDGPAIVPGESYYSRDFLNIDFSNADFRGCEFESCRFTGCNLSNVDISDTKFCDVKFIDSKLMGIPFFNSNPFAFEVSFSGCRLVSCNFTGMKIRDTEFIRCKISESYFQETALTGSDFSGTSFRDTLFHNTNLERCSFVKASGYSISPLNNNIKNAVFDAPEVLNLLNDFRIKIID